MEARPVEPNSTFYEACQNSYKKFGNSQIDHFAEDQKAFHRNTCAYKF